MIKALLDGISIITSMLFEGRCAVDVPAAAQALVIVVKKHWLAIIS